MSLPNAVSGQVYNITIASLAAKSPWNGGNLGLIVLPNTTQQTDASDAAPKMATGDIKYSDLSVHSFFTQNDWSGGEGQRDYGDQTKILTSYGVDLRFTGHAFCGPYITNVGSLAVGGNIMTQFGFQGTDTVQRTWRSYQTVMQYLSGTVWKSSLTGMVATVRQTKAALGKLWCLTEGTAAQHYSFTGVTASGSWAAWTVASGSTAAAGLELYNELLWFGCDNGTDVFVQGTPDGSTYALADKYLVGDRQQRINRIKEYANQLYVGKWDGLYAIDLYDDYARLTYKCNPNTNNFNIMEIFNGELYFNIENGLFRFNGSDMVRVGWNLPDYLPTNRQGHATSALATEDFLFVAINGDSTTYSSIMAYNGRGWATIYVSSTAGTTINSLTYEIGATYDRVYFAEGAVSYYFQVLKYASNPKNVNVSSWFKSGGALESSWFDAGLLKIPKVLRTFTAFGENFSATYYIQVEYKLELDSNAWVALNDATTGNNKITANAGEITPTSAIQFKRIKFRLTFYTDGAQTPSLEALAAKYYVAPPVLYSYSYQVLGVSDSRGLTGWDNKTSAIIVAALESARETVTPLSLTDDLGRTKTVRCTSIQRRANPLRADDQNPQPEQIIIFNCVDI